jgi:hypothetical protein
MLIVLHTCRLLRRTVYVEDRVKRSEGSYFHRTVKFNSVIITCFIKYSGGNIFGYYKQDIFVMASYR